MPTTRRYPSTSRRFRRATPRVYQWENSRTAPASLAPGVTGSTDLSVNVFADNLKKGATVVRVLGHLRLISTDAALSVDFSAALFMRQQSTSIDPTNATYPFMWWMANSAPPASGSVANNFEIDVKSRRKFLWNDADLMFSVKNTDGAQSLEYVIGLRVLFTRP